LISFSIEVRRPVLDDISVKIHKTKYLFICLFSSWIFCSFLKKCWSAFNNIM